MSKQGGYVPPPDVPPNRPQHTGSSTNPFLDPSSSRAPLQPNPTGSSLNPFRTGTSPVPAPSPALPPAPPTNDKMDASTLAKASAPAPAGSSGFGSGSSNVNTSAPAPASVPAPTPASAPPPAVAAEDSMDVALPDEPPPAYTPSADQVNSTSLQAGPTRMDFSGPPPLPDRMTQGHGHAAPSGPPPMRPMEANITGVGVGYGPRIHAQNTGASYAPPSGPPGGHGYAPPPLPSRPSASGSSFGAQSPPPPPPQQQQQQQKLDLSPTEVPTPGRPLLWKGMLLVYPKGFWCQKCGNTGFKQMDPSNPHETDWKKYGKKYTSALAHSYTVSPSAQGNPSTTTAQNFQQPLPNHGAQPARPPQPSHGSSVWDHPGHNRPPPPPPGAYGGPGPMTGHQGGGPGWGPPPPQRPMIMNAGNYIPANAMVVRPGDPRLGGYPCPRCGGNGRETDWLGFDDGKCWQCRGVGRIY